MSHLSKILNKEAEAANPSLDKLALWQRTENPRHRAGIKQSDNKDRKKELDALAKVCETKNVGGKRHFLLHRGMSQYEFSESFKVTDAPEFQKKTEVKNGQGKYRKKSSWSHDSSTAYGFSHEKLGDPVGVMVSAWIPEDKIVVFVPYWKDHMDHFKNQHYSETEGEVIVDSGVITTDYFYQSGATMQQRFSKKSSS